MCCQHAVTLASEIKFNPLLACALNSVLVDRCDCGIGVTTILRKHDRIADSVIVGVCATAGISASSIAPIPICFWGLAAIFFVKQITSPQSVPVVATVH